MKQARLTPEAKSDLASIGRYTLTTWGEAQCQVYLDALLACCDELVELPHSGRPCNHVRPGLLRRECLEHVLFYMVEPDGILVVRILHKRMLPLRHL